MKYYNWKSNLRLNFFVMRFLGLWPKGREVYKPGLYMIYSRFMVFFFVVCHIVPQIINIFVVRNNLQAIVGIVYVGLIEIMAGIKAFFVIRKMKFLKKCIAILNLDWFQPKNQEQILLIQPSINFWKHIYNVILVFSFICNTFMAIYPAMDKSDGIKRLPYLAWYPYDFEKSPFYELTYVFQVLSTCYLILTHISVDTLISGFNVFVGCHFDMLTDNLKNFTITDGFSSDAGQNLIQCIIHHKRILKFMDMCRQFFNWIMFWHLIMSGVSLGLTMYQLTVVKTFSNEFYWLLSYEFAIFSEIFMYCWFGNEVTVKSNLISYAAFDSDWTKEPEDTKKKLLFFIANVLQPVKISAFNIFELSLDTFMSILKTAWSYFALLHQLNT